MAGGRRPYRQGYKYERKEMRYWEARGFWVSRRRASIGPYDIVTTDGNMVYFIEVKSFTGKSRKSYKESIESLKGIPGGATVKKLLVTYDTLTQNREQVEIE